MISKSKSIYSRARVFAGISQESAAELLHLSVRALADYESGQRRPPAQTVEQMAALYDSPGLRLDHARETDELGIIPESAQPCTLERAALRLGNRLRRFCRGDYADRIGEIAEDGRIDEGEAADYRRITGELRSLHAAILALECCSPGIKKERLTAGTVKRSDPQSDSENHSKIIIPEIPPVCKSDFSPERGCAK